MGQIVVLDQNMINMIAAGEVIERPASVVKELMENSIDAGATKITVSIEDGGRKLISITDNGCGMDADDLAQAFESHTTSKIKTSTDLHGIATLGFRGEALASIASIAQVKAVSRTKDFLEANCIELDCGNKAGVSPCSADYGTTIQVRDIFYKLPARRKFLRTANTEMGHINEQFTRIALSNKQLDLTFMGKPDISRTSGKFQYIFLNGRFIRDKFISHAIKEAYRGLLEPNRFPVVFLFIQMSPEDYDVNVHPTKNEVRFYNANFVHSQILGVLREKLLGTNLQTSAKLPPVSEKRISSTRLASGQNRNIADAMAEFFKKHRPAQRQEHLRFQPDTSGTKSENLPGVSSQDTSRDIEYDRKFLQIHDSFIVAQTDEGFVLIDQHALHERIIYEDLCRRIRKSKLQSQKLLMPESFELTDNQAEVLEKNTKLIEQLGIELVPFAPRTMAIQAFPTLLSKAEPLDFIQDLIDILDNKDAGSDPDRLLDEVLNMAACKAAIKAGQKLTTGEIEQLLADKDNVDCSSRCPHGRPTTIEFTISDLEKQFKRT